MWPFKPAWQSRDQEKRLAAVKAMDRHRLDVLIALARHDHDFSVQRASIAKVVDLWLEDTPEIKIAAIAKLGSEDHSLLEYIAQHDEHWQVRSAAISRMATSATMLSGKDIAIALVNIAMTDISEDVRVIAVESLKEYGQHDDSCEFIDSMPLPFKEREALKPNAAFSDMFRRRLVEVAKHDASKRVRDAALRKLANPAALAEIAKNADDEYIRSVAYKKLVEMAATIAARHGNAVAKYPRDHPFRKSLEQSVRECRRALDLVGKTPSNGIAANSVTPNATSAATMVPVESSHYQASIRRVEVFFEPSGIVAAAIAGGSVASFLDDTEAIHKALGTADAHLGLNGALMSFVNSLSDTPEVESVPEMDDSRWELFLNERYNSTAWSRWHAKTSQGRWNVIVLNS